MKVLLFENGVVEYAGNESCERGVVEGEDVRCILGTMVVGTGTTFIFEGVKGTGGVVTGTGSMTVET